MIKTALSRVLPALAVACAPAAHAQNDVAQEVIALVEEHFVFPEKLEADAWRQATVVALASDIDALSGIEREDAVNRLLAALETSHTTYYTPDNPRYHELLDIFALVPHIAEHIERSYPEGVVTYEATGLIVDRTVSGRWWIREILAGSPAAESRIRIGDELLAVDDEPYARLDSISARAGGEATIRVLSSDGAQASEVRVGVERIAPRELFLRSMRASADVQRRSGRALGYVRVYSYAGLHYHEALEEIVASEPIASADGLVLDLRAGWGGAAPGYLNLFNRNVPVLELVDRDGVASPFAPNWMKPVVLLVDSRSRSGNEIHAYAFRKHAYGPVVGERTAGAVVGGSPFLLSDGSLLYLAVRDARVDGESLEGVGVEPDHTARGPFMYCDGLDAQQRLAFRVLEGEISDN